MIGHGGIYLWAVLTVRGLFDLSLVFTLAASVEGSRLPQSSLFKRAFVMLCPGIRVTAGLPPDYGPNHFDGVTSLCFAAGCECAEDRTVQCDRSKGDYRLYDTFAAHCIDPWCHCVTYKEIATGVTPKPDLTPDSENSIGSPPVDEGKPSKKCSNFQKRPWCVFSGPRSGPQCCEGYQCVPQPPGDLSVMLGIRIALKTSNLIIGLCIATQNLQQTKTRSLDISESHRNLFARRMEYSMGCARDSPPLDERIGQPWKGAMTLDRLCRQLAGCRCMEDGTVHCFLAQAEHWEWYATYADRCEKPSWCVCYPQWPALDYCASAARKGSSPIYLPVTSEVSRCCEGYQCQEQQPQNTALFLGMNQVLSYAVATHPSNIKSRSELFKRETYRLSCPTILGQLMPQWSGDTMTTFALCVQAGCHCSKRGTVSCTFDRASSTLWFYATYATKCEQPSWCYCAFTNEGKPQSGKPRQITVPDPFSKGVCISHGQPGYCLPGVSKDQPSMCCDGLHCVEEPLPSARLQFGLQKSLEFALGTCVKDISSDAKLSKRATEYKMMCSDIRATLSVPPLTSEEETYSLLPLCRDAGCTCYPDGQVYCALAQANADLYAEYATRCENPSWCSCHLPGRRRVPGVVSNTCWKDLHAAWTRPYIHTPSPPKKPKEGCCKGSQFVPPLSDKISMLYGFLHNLKSDSDIILGLCVSSESVVLREVSAQSRGNPSLQLNKRDRLEMRCSDGLPITGYPTRHYSSEKFINRFDLCFQVGCRCGYEVMPHCALQRAEDDFLWAAFHSQCENERWCQCWDPEIEKTPVSQTTVQRPTNEKPESPSVGNWCSVPDSAPHGQIVSCRAGQYCVSWSGINLAAQYGVRRAISAGICFNNGIASSLPAKRYRVVGGGAADTSVGNQSL